MLLGHLPQAAAQISNTLVLDNPNWNITLTDAGYSDWLYDNTPGFEGREYLSGEWGAAIGYTRASSSQVVTPQWLERNFSYPDWTTNSTFNVISPIAMIGTNAAGLPIAQSVISNGDLRITQRFEMLDTITGRPMGITAASAGGTGASISSNRYVLQQTYTVTNISGDSITNVELFQFLHGLNAASGVYDNRLYTGSLSDHRYDVTLNGIDLNSVGVSGSSDVGLHDYIGFGASVAPTAFEIGNYGTASVDSHGIGKPSDGVHLSIEDNWTHTPYSSRQGTDSFAPAEPWVAGAERWNLGTLGDGASKSFNVVLSIRTGTGVSLGGTDSGGGSGTGPTGGTGSCNGGAGHIGGVDFQFEDVTKVGTLFGEFSEAGENEMLSRISEGEFAPINFTLAGSTAQLWELEFDGEYSGAIQLTFAYDPALFEPGFDFSQLAVFHYTHGNWEQLNGFVDTGTNTIQVTSGSLSPFVLGVVPEPSSGFLASISGIGVLSLLRRRR